MDPWLQLHRDCAGAGLMLGCCWAAVGLPLSPPVSPCLPVSPRFSKVCAGALGEDSRRGPLARSPGELGPGELCEGEEERGHGCSMFLARGTLATGAPLECRYPERCPGGTSRRREVQSDTFLTCEKLVKYQGTVTWVSELELPWRFLSPNGGTWRAKLSPKGDSAPGDEENVLRKKERHTLG